jgi:hypothetical protein
VKLYLQGQCGHKIFLTSPALTRADLPAWFHLICPHDQQGGYYSTRNVFAEPESGQTAGGAILGGLVGLLAGPIGLILGGTAGASLGAATEKTELARAKHFNES